MDHHQAYQLLSSVLDTYRGRSSSELEAFVGRVQAERARAGDGEEFLVDVEVSRCDESDGSFLVTASADSPSTYRMERIEEQLIVHSEPPDRPMQPDRPSAGC